MIKALLFTAAIVIGNNCYAQDLDTYRKKYDDALKNISADHQQKIEYIAKKYSSSLNALKARVQATGDLDKVKAVLEEISRFKTSQTFPAPEQKLIPEIMVVLKDCNSSISKADQAKAQQIVTLFSKYDKSLRRLEKEYTRKGELDKATAIQNERKALAESESVTSANALLAKASEPSPKLKLEPADKQGVLKPEILIVPSDPSVNTDIGILRVGERMGNNRGYKFDRIPEELQGLNFIRMECRNHCDYDVQVHGRVPVYILVVSDRTDGSELRKDGWKKTGYTIQIDTRASLLVYEKLVSNQNFNVKSTGNWAYMLATKVPIKITSSNN